MLLEGKEVLIMIPKIKKIKKFINPLIFKKIYQEKNNADIHLSSFFWKISLILLMVLGFSGCIQHYGGGFLTNDYSPAYGNTEDDQILGSLDLSKYRVLQVCVNSNIEGTSRSCCRLRDKIVKRLKKRKLFGQIFVDSEKDESIDLILNVTIVKLKRVGAAERLIFGGIAGKAIIITECHLIDAKANNQLGVFTTKGKSASGEECRWLAAGTTKQAVKFAAIQIVKFFRKHVIPTS